MPVAQKSQQQKKLSAAQVATLHFASYSPIIPGDFGIRRNTVDALWWRGYLATVRTDISVKYRITEAGRAALAALAESEAKVSEDKS